MDQHPQAAAPARWWGPSSAPSASTDVMNQLCRVCGEPAAGFHFGAFTCEGCKSFFGRTYNNLGSISECKNNGKCVITKKNRTSCKACRLRKCLVVGMSKSGSRYGRRSNWFKIHCLLQEQQQSQMPLLPKGKGWEGLLESSNVSKEGSERVRDRERELPGPPGYSAEAAAALWAARGALLPPVHPHPHSQPHQHPPPLPFFPSFLQTPFHPPPPSFALLPFAPLRPPAPPSESSASTASPPPTDDRLDDDSPESQSSPEPPREVPADRLAVFRSLGPVQESPMDLSCRQTGPKEDKVPGEYEIQDQNSNIVSVGESSKDDTTDSVKRSPLDLTCLKT